MFSGSFVFGAGCVLAGLGCSVASNLSLYYSVAAASSRGHRGGIHEAVLASGAAVIPLAGGLLATTPLQIGGNWAKSVPHLLAGTVLLLVFLFALRFFVQSQARLTPSTSRS